MKTHLVLATAILFGREFPLLAENPTTLPAPAESVSSGKTFEPMDDLHKPLEETPNRFVIVPGKDPNGWSFTLEPYLWAMGMSGDVAVKGSPATHVNYDTKTILQHLDWGVMGKAEVRKGRWGILGDGLFAQLSASGTPPGPLYDGTSIKFQQGMASLALAFRVIDDRRGFLDIYAGARYNYIGIELSSSTDTSGINQVASATTDRISDVVGQRVQSAVAAAEQSLRARLSAAEQRAVTAVEERVQARLSADEQRAVAAEERVSAVQQDLIAARRDLELARLKRGAGVARDLEKRFRRDLFIPSLRERNMLTKPDIHRVARGTTGEFRSYVRAVVDARIAGDEARLAALRGRADTSLEAAKSRAEARVSAAQKKLTKAIAKEIEDVLPTYSDGSQWWVDPIVGLRFQINFTRWLFLGAQGDVGGFGAGSDIAWNVQASLGVNFTRNIFAEVGYRYFYMDYQNGGALYNAAEFGIFSGVGVKF